LSILGTPAQTALVDSGWVSRHLDDPDVQLIEIAGMGGIYAWLVDVPVER
jgi:hypothetical protein